MISLDDLATKGKDEIRQSDELSKAFEFYFLEKYNEKPSFCCTFSDYGKLFNNQKKFNMAQKSEKYIVDYPPTYVLAYRKDKKTYRSMVKNADDKFFDEFLKNYAEAHFPSAKKRITLKEQPKKKSVKKKTDGNANKEK